MIAKQTKGRGFRGALNYVLGKDGAEIVGSNMLGESARELASEFAESRKLRPGLKRAVYHASLSLAPGERLSDERWAEVAGAYTRKMGFEKSQYVAVRHTDTGHDHIHIIASRIGLDGKYVSESNDYQRSETIVRELEREHGLTRVTPSHEIERRAPSRGEILMAEKGIPSVRLQLQGLVDSAMRDKPTMTRFLERLESSGVQAVPNIAQTGHVSGISYLLGDEQMKGSDLGKGYTWAGLQKRGVNYDQDRDFQAISRAREQGAPRLASRGDREEPSKRLGADRGSDRTDGPARRDDGGHDTRNQRAPERDEERSRAPHTRSRERDISDDPDGAPARRSGGSPDVEALDSDDSGSGASSSGRGERLLALAASLRAGAGSGGGVAGLPIPGGAPNLSGARKALKNPALESEEVDENEIPLRNAYEEPESPSAIKVERKPKQPERDRGRSGPDFSF